MSNPLKEPGYYWRFDKVKDYFARKGITIESRHDLLANHMLKNYKGEPVFGEASTYYTIGNYSTNYKIPQKIMEENPQMRFIYILRNPLERLVSNYLHELHNKTTKLDFNSYILQSSNGKAALLTSLYYFQIEKYLDLFSIHQFKVLAFEEFLSNTQVHLIEIYKFLGIAEFPNHTNLKAFNVSENRRSISTGELKFSIDAFRWVTERVFPDIKKLESVLDRRFDIWDISQRRWCP